MRVLLRKATGTARLYPTIQVEVADPARSLALLEAEDDDWEVGSVWEPRDSDWRHAAFLTRRGIRLLRDPVSPPQAIRRASGRSGSIRRTWSSSRASHRTAQRRMRRRCSRLGSLIWPARRNGATRRSLGSSSRIRWLASLEPPIRPSATRASDPSPGLGVDCPTVRGPAALVSRTCQKFDGKPDR